MPHERRQSPFRQRLEAAVQAKHSRMNPFTEKWVKGELSREQLGAWAVPALPVRLAVRAVVRRRVRGVPGRGRP